MPAFFKLKAPLFWSVAILILLATTLVVPGPSVSQAVTVGPAKLQISTDPGESATGFLFVKNDSSERQAFRPLIQKFSQSADGQKVFTSDPGGIAAWMDLPQSVELDAGEGREVPFILNVPEDAPPGGHFAVVWWSAAPAGEGSQVAIVTRAGVLVYLRVSGDIVEKGSIASFEGGSRFAWGLPISFTTHFENEGNVALTPQGEVRVANMFGAQKATLPVNPYGAIILPGSNESFAVTWPGEGFFFGLYTAELDLQYGEGGLTDQASWRFVMISPWAAAILILVILLAFVAPPVVRRYNRWIIERAKEE